MRGLLYAVALLLLGCGGESDRSGVVLRISASASGAEGAVLSRQLARFMLAHPGVHVESQATPESADQRHQLYVQWLNAGVGHPDVLQLDVVWTAEFATAGFIRPLDAFADGADFVPAARDAATHEGRLFAAPWFVDVGMLYYRTDLLREPPATFADLERLAAEAQREHGVPYGFVWQGARYEGLVTVFQEVLGGYGGTLVGERGHVAVDSAAGRRALSFLDGAIRRTHVTPEAVLTWQEEQSRFAFQSGRAAFLRNWPYAIALLRDEAASRVAGRFSVARMPAEPGGEPTSALGGQELAVNAHSAHPEEATELIRFLIAPEQMLERARVAGQLPARLGPYEDPELEAAFGVSRERLREIVLSARPRPVTPVYTELSESLQIALHRALTGQLTVDAALASAAAHGDRVLAAGRRPSVQRRDPRPYALLGAAVFAGVVALGIRRLRSAGRAIASERAEQRLGLLLVAPLAVVITAVALVPLAWTAFESFFSADLRHPAWGRPFIGLDNYVEAFRSSRFRQAVWHTVAFVAASVTLELAAGFALALVLDKAFRGRGLVRTTVLLPWAIPTVVAALLFRFAFETDAGPVNALLERLGASPVGWLSSETLAWVPLVAGDVWKTSPFVALLLLAGLQSIDQSLYEAARMDGARTFATLWHVTLPELRPAILVAVLFRALDAVRAFDLFYVLTGGGPGTATEPVALLAYQSLFQSLRFGYGSALSLLVFGLAAVFVILAVRSMTPGGEAS